MRVVPFTAISRQVKVGRTSLMKPKAFIEASRVSDLVGVEVDSDAVSVGRGLGPFERPCGKSRHGSSATIPLESAQVAEY